MQGTAESTSGSGVLGFAPALSGNTKGVYGTGIVGVRGESSSGRGGVFIGTAAQVRLSPSSASSHPVSGSKGDLFVDTSGRLWFCKGATTWHQLA